MEDSVFAKIVAGELPAHKVYEDDTTLAFLNIYPRAPYHTLVIPKITPAQFVWDLDDDTYHAVMTTCKKVALRLRKVSGEQYVHQGIVGIDVPYAHVHLIPFTDKANFEKPEKTGVEPDHDALAKMAEKLRFS